MLFAEKFRLLSPLSVDREINERQVTFYTCSVRTCARLSGLIAQLVGHFTTLLGSNSGRDQGQTEEIYAPPEGEVGEILTKTVVEPINPDLAALRVKQRAGAVQGAIETLLSKANRAAIGEMLMDSLKDDFPRGKKRPADECLEFIDSMDVPTLVLFLKGLAKANAEVFGDLGKALGRAAQSKAEELFGGQVNVEVRNEDQPTDG